MHDLRTTIMEKIMCGFVLPMLLLSAALLNWSLISLVNLSAFLVVQFTAPKLGSQFLQRQYLVLRSICFFSFLVIVSQVIFYIISVVEGDQWCAINSKWTKLIGFIRVDSWKRPSEIYVFIIQILVAFIALLKLSFRTQLGLAYETHTCLEQFCSSLEQIGSHLKVLCYLLLPPVQLIAGISHPSWASFPFFICSGIGLIRWSLTSKFLGLYWWWRCLLLYAGSNIILLYLYQLQMNFPGLLMQFVEFVGMYKLSASSEWSEICSGLSLLSFYILLSWIRCDLAEMDKTTTTRDNNLMEHLISSNNTLLLIESRSDSMYSNILSWREFFQNFNINFFTYGLPVLLLALSFWGIHFASLCSFGLLAYVGYIIYVSPSMFHLHRLNGLLLVFIILWAASTYVFNLTFSILNKRICQDMEIWESIGLWHYTIPGFYLLAQFFLGILVAMGNLVNNSVFLCLSVGARHDDNYFIEEKEEMKVLVVATIAWVLRKCYRAIVLCLLFLLSIKPGIFHAAYLVFFLVYLLSHNINKKLCRALILLCETHFSLLYILNLHLVSKLLNQKGSVSSEILRQLGLGDINSYEDLLKIMVLVCFCAIHNHGIDVLFSSSAIVQQTPFPPVGFSILRAGLIKSVLFSVYTSQSVRKQHIFSPQERRIMMYLSAIGEKFLSMYRSCGTYIAFFTILVAVYRVQPNHIFFGYVFFLLLWISGRQLLQRTMKHLWFPLKLYSIAIFIFIYSLGVFTNFQLWLSKLVDLSPVIGYDPKASIMDNIAEPLAILISIQLFSYERRRSQNGTYSKSNSSGSVALTLSKRFLMWHIEKILYVAVLYASISPIGAFGFLYILCLVICSTLPKSSKVPSKLFLVYSGCLLMMDYLFQIWGEKVEMFPNQRNHHFSILLGLKLHESSFWGLESGFRGKVVVIVACVFQYSIFHWLDHIPNDQTNTGKWGEACDLFGSKEEILNEISKLTHTGLHLDGWEQLISQSWPSFSSEKTQGPNSMPYEENIYNQGSKRNQYLYTYFWESYKGNQKWNRRRIIYLRRERLHKQKALLKIYTKFWIQNMSGLFGLEINMVVLLLASFAVLNAISIIYVACLVTCVILNRRLLQRLWPVFVFLFAFIVLLEYLAIWLDIVSMKNGHSSGKVSVTCHDCWRSSEHHFDFCKKCWFGIVVDDSRMLISYYMVYMFSCFKLKADHYSSLPDSQMYQCLISYCKNASLLSDLSFETKELWTLLDYVRHYSYCHLLDFFLALILIIGTLEYDIMHLGYLGFALVFFRMRLQILKKKNKLFKLLRIYNFALIVLSLAYQSPFIGDFIEGKCATVDYISQVIGFYKYDYGFRITSRSALVEIVIFMLVSLQSFMFSSQAFDYVSKYLEAEQIGAIVREQEKRASWKSAHLRNIRKSEEQKRQRNLQVEKMKSEMLNLQIHLQSNSTPSKHECFTRRMNSDGKNLKAEGSTQEWTTRNHGMEYDFLDPKYNLFPTEMDESPKNIEGDGSPSSVDSVNLNRFCL
ncbi:hypothetical protein SAY87_010548 [Trapa incisa]|uniref:Piezo-type mechanosensitive ion channel homolog domain-containing protein n=1 Tax=Trapa incisa TaxID=236973 RepID=A0AAN7GEQ6_9MYRT|nr:hypothetical protein SAY87_010548 [Trapa incisa]